MLTININRPPDKAMYLDLDKIMRQVDTFEEK